MLPISPALAHHFEQLVASGHLGHGYILHGSAKGFPREASMYLALAALCATHPPCQSCATCRQVRAHDHPNIRVMATDAPSVDAIRHVVRDIQLGARAGHRLFVCILHSYQMTPQAANAFLKTLEEPPQGVTMVLATPALEQLLPTIRSRCTSIPCPSVSDTTVRAWIRDKTGEDYTGLISHAMVTYIDKTGQLPQHIVPLDTLARRTPSETLALAETLAKDKTLAKLAMQQWLEEAVAMATAAATHTQHMQNATQLLTHIQNSHYNLNTRLQLEALLFSLQS